MKVALYIRCSTNEQNPDMQVREIKEYLATKGITEFEIYEDVGISGSNPNRPALKRLLDDCKQGKVQIICIWKLDRLFRSLRHLVNTLNDFAAWGVNFISIRDNIDLTTPAGRLQFHIVGAFAEFERDIIAMRVKSGMANAKAKGVKLGRPTTMSKPIAERIRVLRASGMTYRAIAKETQQSLGAVQRVLDQVEPMSA